MNEVDITRRLDAMRNIALELDPWVAFTLLGALQLALRHPGMKTLSAAGPAVERVARILHGLLETQDAEVGRICEQGFHEVFDVDWRRDFESRR